MCMAEFWRCNVVLKFSPTLLVGGGKHHHLIRWSVVTLGKQVRTRGSLMRSSSSSATARTPRHDETRRGLRESRRAELYFAVREIIGLGYCNRPKTRATWTWPTLYPLGFSQAALYKVLHCVRCLSRTNLGFANLDRKSVV